MASTEEITLWLNRLSDGEERAAEVIWNQYFEKLTRYARRKLEGMPRRVLDEEDVALSAMNSFCRGMEQGRFAKVDDREDLWKLLVTITANKAISQQRRHHAAKRGGGQVRGESVFVRKGDADLDPGIGDVLGSEPTPEFACAVAENCQAMLDALEDEMHQNIAQLTLEGYTTTEIAERLGCVKRTVERKLNRIREKWAAMDDVALG